MTRSWLTVALLGTIAFPIQAQKEGPGQVGVSAGLAWMRGIQGYALRAEYSLRPSLAVANLTVELAGRWTPTKVVDEPAPVFGSSATFFGERQRADIAVGLVGRLAPWPRAPIGPYFVAGAALVQHWDRNAGGFLNAAAGVPSGYREFSSTSGTTAAVLGFGLQARVGSRLLRAEARRYAGASVISLGTVVRF